MHICLEIAYVYMHVNMHGRNTFWFFHEKYAENRAENRASGPA